ncbi:MAG: Uma2 family endonuclease [Candidatus Eremiobacteraeota bacterium]|nr:Uma2 family endonuclease [Candidatus Eremiobacteraeota bacterium]
MQEAPDLGIPEVKPAIESIRGTWEQKVSPRRRHALVQGRLWQILTSTFGEAGEVGTEWRFYILPPKEKPSSLVPDVAYVSYERMPPDLGELREKPTIAPDIAVEVFSPDDRQKLLEEKIGIYLDNGSRLVIVADPLKRIILMHDSNGTVQFSNDDIAVADVYPQLRIYVSKLYERI